MSAVPASRVNYFDRQFIRLAELTRRAGVSPAAASPPQPLASLLGHRPRARDPAPGRRPAGVRPGLAVDGYGRELLLLDRGGVRARVSSIASAPTASTCGSNIGSSSADDRSAPAECGVNDPRAALPRHRARRDRCHARRRARPTRGARPGVPATALDEPLLATPDDPRRRWPVYLGRIIMAGPGFRRPDLRDRHRRPRVCRPECGAHRPSRAMRAASSSAAGRRHEDVKQVGDDAFRYAADPDRDFAVFVPDPDAHDAAADARDLWDRTQIRGTAEVHGNLVLDGAPLQFPDATRKKRPRPTAHPAIYRASGSRGDELRIDIGVPQRRRIVRSSSA